MLVSDVMGYDKHSALYSLAQQLMKLGVCLLVAWRGVSLVTIALMIHKWSY